MKKILLSILSIITLLSLSACSKTLSTIPYEVKEGEEVVLIPENFVASQNTYEADELVLKSDLMTDDSKYDYDPLTHVVVTKGKDYLEQGSYDVWVESTDGNAASTSVIVSK